MKQTKKRWIHVSFSWPTGGEQKQFEEVFNKAADWIRYSRNCWLVYTGLDIEKWAERVRDIPGMGDQNIFVVDNVNVAGSSGFLSEWMWNKLYTKDS